jgi:hypothetical protein
VTKVCFNVMALHAARPLRKRVYVTYAMTAKNAWQ